MARDPILSLQDICLSIGMTPLFEAVSQTLGEGERLALVGRNGSGKSTLLKIMAGLLEADHGSIVRAAGKAVGYMEQHPDFTGFSTLGDYAVSGMEPGSEYLVERVGQGLKLNLDADPKTASGGERRRAALAKIVAEAPDLMLLDEPTNHLDIEAIGWLENHLSSTRSGFVLISHDRAFLRALARSTLWIDRGVLRRLDRGFEHFEDWRDTVFQQEDLERHKLNRLIKAEARWAVEGISARRTRNQGRVRRLASLRGDRASLISRPGVARLDLDSGPKSGRLVIEARALSKTYAGKPIVTDFSLRIQRGERVAFVGPNGIGKTTLVNMLIGALEPDSGKLRLGHGLEIAHFDQNRAALDDNASLWESLTQDADLGVSGKNDQVMVRGVPRHVVGYLKDFLFDEDQARGPVRALSGGEKARLLLARLMARESNVLVLDEPTNDLDIETLDLLQEVLDDYAGTVLLVSHDRDFLDRVATTTIALEEGGKATVYAGGWSDYQAQKRAISPETPAAQKTAPKTAKTPRRAEAAKRENPTGLSFVEAHRLKELPGEMERLEAEIVRLEGFLSTPDLFSKAPEKFKKASEGLAARQARLAAAEEDWLDLEERSGA